MKIDKLNEGQVRMAVLPSPDRVLYTPGLWVPLAQVNNVLIFPGVPRLFHQMIDHWFDSHLSSSGLLTIPRIRRLVKTFEKESVLAGRLAGFQDQGKQLGIEIGSYPKLLKDGQTFVVLSIIGPKAQEDKVEQLAGRIIMEFNGTSYDLEQDE